MTKTRDNHYVPQWYQEGFFEPSHNTLAYLDMSPRQHALPDGRTVLGRAKFDSPTSRAFFQRDLYSTFFGTSINDEIERKLFGDIDTRGSQAIRAFINEDASGWHRHFQTFFENLDIQKIRTPKGLDWLSAQYPKLTQNELMMEMQGIRMMHCTIWVEGVKEIVSAEDADTKFIISDHPVTIYNPKSPPGSKLSKYPNEPTIALKGTQTIYPLNRDFCLIVTNLEYAQDPTNSPLKKRTFSGNYRNSMVRTDAIIRTRRLASDEVVQVNRIIKARAKRYIAAGKEEWLYPERYDDKPWADMRRVLLPPANDLWQFGGEMFARFESGEIHYQDAFGRTEKEREFLKKSLPSRSLRARDLCPCGSGRAFGVCCERRPEALRPTWRERSIRERNLMLWSGMCKILEIAEHRDWVTVRREVTDDKIKEVYRLFDALWPLETNLMALLPKPDGEARAVYTGALHPSLISRCALGLPLYFNELLVEHPFAHPRAINKKFSPIEHPKTYRQEFLKSVVLFMSIYPLVESGNIILFPDPGNFDPHLRSQMFSMARDRNRDLQIDPNTDSEMMKMMKEERKRSLLLLSREALRHQVVRAVPNQSDEAVERTLDGFDILREEDPLAVLQEGSLEGGADGGQLNAFRLAPNFEITMYLAQATGSCIVTDSVFRWREFKRAAKHGPEGVLPLKRLHAALEQAEFLFPAEAHQASILAEFGVYKNYPSIMRRIFKNLASYTEKGEKPNFDLALSAEFVRAHRLASSEARKSKVHLNTGRVSCLWPAGGGIQDNTVNRLLLMSSSELHMASVPMAFFIEAKF